MKNRQKQREIKRDMTPMQAAEELGVSLEDVRRCCRQGAPHEKKDGRIRLNLGEFLAWRQANGKTGLRGVSPSRINTADSATLEQARLRKENALAARYELQVQRERAEVIPAVEVRRRGVELLTLFKNRLRGLPAKLTVMMEGRDAAERQDLIGSEIDAALRQLAEDIARLGEGGAAAAEGDAQPVG